MNYIAHAGHPNATNNSVEHGIAHWVIILPITLVVILLLAIAVRFLSKRKVKEVKADD